MVEDVEGGGLLSGGILDMIAAKHTPVRPVPPQKLSAGALKGASMAVNVDSQSLSPEQREILRSFTRSGGTLLPAHPAGSKSRAPLVTTSRMARPNWSASMKSGAMSSP